MSVVKNLSFGNPIFNEQFTALKTGLSALYGNAVAEAKAGGLFYMRLVEQSTLLAFMDCFKIAGFLCLALIPFVYLLKNKAKTN